MAGTDASLAASCVTVKSCLSLVKTTMEKKINIDFAAILSPFAAIISLVDIGKGGVLSGRSELAAK